MQTTKPTPAAIVALVHARTRRTTRPARPHPTTPRDPRDRDPVAAEVAAASRDGCIEHIEDQAAPRWTS